MRSLCSDRPSHYGQSVVLILGWSRTQLQNTDTETPGMMVHTRNPSDSGERLRKEGWIKKIGRTRDGAHLRGRGDTGFSPHYKENPDAEDWPSICFLPKSFCFMHERKRCFSPLAAPASVLPDLSLCRCKGVWLTATVVGFQRTCGLPGPVCSS